MNLSPDTIKELKGLLKKAEGELAQAHFMAEADRKRAIASSSVVQQEEETYKELLELMAHLGITKDNSKQS